MRKIRYWIIILLLVFLTTACTNKQAAKTNMTLQEMGDLIIESQSQLPTLEHITKEEKEFDTYLSDNYHILDNQVEDGIIYYADGVEASEIAILKLSNEKDYENIEKAMKTYINNRSSIFEGYAPQQAAMIKDGIVVVNGQYVALLICQDVSKAKSVFLDCFKENNNSKSKAEGTYDSSKILKAWKTGDDSSLSNMNLNILNAAKDVIQKETDDNMSNYEKELVIHDWITNNSNFDYSVFSRSSEQEFENGSDTPYGVLIEKEGMCHGYSSTFQLFMDMLDIECITVYGIPNSNGVEHSWNMVKLDGDCYCVYVAWDDPIAGSPEHTYFNVTSQFLRESGIHRWDESNVPEATATTYSYKNQ